MIDGFPSKQLTGTQIPSGRDVMCNFIYKHHSKNLPIQDSTLAVYDQLMTFCNENRRSVPRVGVFDKTSLKEK